MDGGFRAPRPVERRTASRPEQARRPDEPQPAADEPKPVHRAASRHVAREEKSSKRFLWPVIVAVAVIILGVGGWFAWSKMGAAAPAIDDSKYQAVSTTDGQIYFGKLSVLDNDYVKLANAYYLQPQAKAPAGGENATQTAGQNDVKLIKLSNKIYGPEDEIIIAKRHILSYENLKPDGQVADWLKNNADK